MKYFIITIDTEGDNLWCYKSGEKVMTENSLYIPRFQELCEMYGFKPVWLTNYEMVCDQRYVDYIKPKMEAGLCEVGIHVHAWNNPPLFELVSKYEGNPYLIEYPYGIMRQKFKVTYDLLTLKFGKKPISHRAGRWAMDKRYFQLLKEFEIKVDCSYTPNINWTGMKGATMGGSNYKKVNYKAHFIGPILEVPMTTRLSYCAKGSTIYDMMRNLLKGKILWARPSVNSVHEIINLCKRYLGNCEYVEFMLHSSEFMAGGSPYYKTTESIDELFKNLTILFEFFKSEGYKGVTLNEYYDIISSHNCKNS